jgi:hypothetical protein
MALCSNCGSEGTRVRSRWNAEGVQLPDQCPICDPGSFEKFTAPSDKKIWMGFEANPNEYEKRYDANGVYYVRKPEYVAEQEQRLMQATEEELEKQQRAVAQKRATRRTTPMDSAEQAAALRKAEQIADWILASAARGRDVN